MAAAEGTRRVGVVAAELVVTELSEAYELSNVVETALAKALVLAAEAKRWDVVTRIAEELRRRGSARHCIPKTLANKASTRS